MATGARRLRIERLLRARAREQQEDLTVKTVDRIDHTVRALRQVVQDRDWRKAERMIKAATDALTTLRSELPAYR